MATNVTLTDNEFFSGLANLALVVRLYATNDNKFSENFVDNFATDTVEYGNQKIFPYSQLPGVTDYSETSSLLTVTKVDAGEEAIKIDQKKVIKSSYSATILMGAFTDEAGMNNFIGYMLAQMESAKYKHLYEKIVEDLFAKTFKGSMQNRVVKLLNTEGITDPNLLNQAEIMNQKRIKNAMQEDIDNMKVFSDKYNGKGMNEALDVPDLRLVITAPYNNEQVLNLMAELLNSDVIDKSFDKPKKLVIPKISIPAGEPNKKVVGWIMHRYAFQWFYKFTFMGEFFDVSNLVINNFYHFWYGKGFLDFLPVVKITTELETPARA